MKLLNVLLVLIFVLFGTAILMGVMKWRRPPTPAALPAANVASVPSVATTSRDPAPPKVRVSPGRGRLGVEVLLEGVPAAQVRVAAALCSDEDSPDRCAELFSLASEPTGAVTDEDGSLELDLEISHGLSQDRDWLVVAYRADLGAAWELLKHSRIRSGDRIRLSLDQGLAVRGRVLGPDQQAVSGAWVHVVTKSSSSVSQRGMAAITDQSGQFLIRGLRPAATLERVRARYFTGADGDVLRSTGLRLDRLQSPLLGEVEVRIQMLDRERGEWGCGDIVLAKTVRNP